MAGSVTYKVKQGDTLSSLGLPEEILKLNPGISKLSAGQTIRIPIGSKMQAGGGGMIPGQQTGSRTGVAPGGGGITYPPTASGRPAFSAGGGGITYPPTTTGRPPVGGVTPGGGGITYPPTNTIGGHNRGAGTTQPPTGGWDNATGQGSGFSAGGGGIDYGSGAPGGGNKPALNPNAGGTGLSNDATQWIDFTKITPGMTWTEYNTRLAIAKQNGYNGPWLSPGQNGVGVLGWGPGRPIQGASYNDNGTPSGVGQGNISTTSSYGGSSLGRQRVSSGGKGKGGQPNTSALDTMNEMLKRNPQLANDPAWAQLLAQLQGATAGNTGSNSAVNSGMNWRF